jgi:hypothetical protein
LAVGFGVEGCTEPSVDAESVAKSLPESCCKLGASIGHDAVGEAMEAEDVGDEQVSEVICIHVGSARYEVSRFSQSVDYYPDGVASI